MGGWRRRRNHLKATNLIPHYLQGKMQFGTLISESVLRDLYGDVMPVILLSLVLTSGPAWFILLPLLLVNKFTERWFLQPVHSLRLLQDPSLHKEESQYTSGWCGSGWHGFLSSLGDSVPSGLHIRTRRMIRDKRTSIPEYVPGPEKLHMEWSLPTFINMFLPEFPHRNVPEHEHFQVGGKSSSSHTWHYGLLFHWWNG